MGRKKKLRIPLRKNTQKKGRGGQRQALSSDAPAETTSVERIRGRREESRYRTVMVETTAAGAGIVLDVDESQCLRGRVLRAIGLTSQVRGDDGRVYECTVRQVLRRLNVQARNAVVAGDHVLFQPGGDDQGVIQRVEPRRSVLSRGSHRREHILVSNVDQVLVVVSAVDPPLKTNLVDRFLISAEKGGVAAVVCINKIDRLEPSELQSVAGLYGQLGYDVVLTSALTGQGIPRLRQLMRNRETVLSGQSGVGKSSLLNAVQPGLALRTSTVIAESGKGRHTTRVAELLPLDIGGWVVDTPGIRQMELWDVSREEVEMYFLEFRPFVRYCRFPDCLHTHEEGCGVKRAVARDLISEDRYESYVRIVTGDLA